MFWIRAISLMAPLLGLCVHAFGVDQTIVVAAKENPLNLSQSNLLAADAPFGDVLIDQKGGAWIAGRTSVWRWSLEQHTVVRLPVLAEGSDERLMKLRETAKGVYAASNKSVYQVDFTSKKLTRFDHPKFAAGKTLNLVRSDSGLWWVHQDGIVQIQQGKEHQPNVHAAPELRGAELAWLDSKNLVVWFSTGGRLSTADLRHHPIKVKEVHTAKDAFLGLDAVGADLFAHTNYTVLKFDSAQQSLTQIIPVDVKKKLLAMDIEDSAHTYLFNDSLLEFFEMKSQAHFQTRLALPTKVRIDHIKHQGNFTVVVMDTKVTSFFHRAALETSDASKAPAKG